MTRHERETLKEVCGMLDGIGRVAKDVDICDALDHARKQIYQLLQEDDE